MGQYKTFLKSLNKLDNLSFTPHHEIVGLLKNEVATYSADGVGIFYNIQLNNLVRGVIINSLTDSDLTNLANRFINYVRLEDPTVDVSVNFISKAYLRICFSLAL